MNLFDRKVIALEIVLLIFCIAIVACIIFDDTMSDEIANALLLIAVIIVGVIFRQKTVRRIKQQERLEALTLQLKKANSELADANEKLKVLNTEKNEFLSFATHQLGSPLSAIVGYASMLYDESVGPISAQQKGVVSDMREAAHNLHIMVKDFLTISKMEQGGMHYDMKHFDFEMIAFEVVYRMELSAQAKGLTMRLQTDRKAPYTIVGDGDKVGQAIVNIIDNATKYTPSGTITVRLSKHKKSRSVVFEVSDTGIGIAPEDHALLFQKFGRGGNTAGVSSGSGLGLYLAKQIVEAHNGRIEVCSDGVGKGSRFSLILPQA